MLGRRIILTVLICGVTLGVLLSEALATTPQGESTYAQTGPFAVETVPSVVLQDPERGTDVLVRLYYPAGDGPFPVIVFSHGLGGDKDIFGAISMHWASHGYVAVHPTHDDSGVGMTARGMQPPAEKVRNRLRDVTAVLDALDQIESKVPALGGKLDRRRLGVAGHSYGSFITMLSGGVTVSIGRQVNVNLGDPRVQCILPISPSGRGDYGMSDASWNNLTIPALFVTGTRDVRNGRAEDWRMEPYKLSPAGNKYLIVIEGASHGQFGGDVPSDAPAYVKTASVAFWDSCLNGARDGKAYLEDGFIKFADGAATIEFK